MLMVREMNMRLFGTDIVTGGCVCSQSEVEFGKEIDLAPSVAFLEHHILILCKNTHSHSKNLLHVRIQTEKWYVKVFTGFKILCYA